MEIFWTDAAGAVQSIKADATLKELHSGNATPTTHPVERGANITDHVVAESREYTADLHVSNTPIRQPTTQTNGVRGGVGAVDLGVARFKRLATGVVGSQPATWDDVAETASANVLTFQGALERTQGVFRTLDDLRVGGTLLTLTTGLQEYPDCLLTGVEAPVTSDGVSALTITVHFLQARFATSETVEAPAPIQPRGRRRANRGNTPTTPITPAQVEAVKEVVTSIAHDTIEWIRS